MKYVNDPAMTVALQAFKTCMWYTWPAWAEHIQTFPAINIHVTYWDQETRQYPTMYLNFSLAFAAGTSKGCLGVPFRCLKHDSKIPMGLSG